MPATDAFTYILKRAAHIGYAMTMRLLISIRFSHGFFTVLRAPGQPVRNSWTCRVEAASATTADEIERAGSPQNARWCRRPFLPTYNLVCYKAKGANFVPTAFRHTAASRPQAPTSTSRLLFPHVTKRTSPPKRNKHSAHAQQHTNKKETQIDDHPSEEEEEKE